MNGAYAVGHFKTVLIPSLDNAREAVSFGKAYYVYVIARGESFDRKALTYRILAAVVEFEFFKNLLGFYACFFELSVIGFVKVFFFDFAEAYLNRRVTVLFGSLDLNYRARTRLDDRYGDYFSVCGKDLGHAQFFSNDCFIHR